MMGLGYWLTEKVIYDPDSGQLFTHNTWVRTLLTIIELNLETQNPWFFSYVQEYKPPSSKDIPIDLRVELLKNAPNPVGFLGSKGKWPLLYDLALVCVALQFVSTPGLFTKSSLLGIPVVSNVYWYSDLTKFFLLMTTLSPPLIFLSVLSLWWTTSVSKLLSFICCETSYWKCKKWNRKGWAICFV